MSCERPRMIQPVAQQSPALASDAARPTWHGVQNVPPRHVGRSSKQSKRLEVYARLSGCIIRVWMPRVSPMGHNGGYVGGGRNGGGACNPGLTPRAPRGYPPWWISYGFW